MTFLVDANVLLYSAVESPYRAPCTAVLEAIARGEADGRTSTAVLEEVWHLERSGRVGALDGLTEQLFALLTPLLAVTDDAFRHALALAAAPPGANDRVHAGTCIAYGIETVLSADRDFDGVPGLRRVDPLDGPALRLLLERG